MDRISKHFNDDASTVVFDGDCCELLREIPDGAIQLVVTSPPYNIGKVYEKRLKLDAYLKQQESVIDQCVRVLSDKGSICWQVGNYIENGSIMPLDAVLFPIFRKHGLKMRNRIIWHFEHGLHCSKRLSGRYETIIWFTKTDDYTFDVNPIRVPQKYPGKKYFKGPNAGMYSCNPLGKNPGDLWTIPNVKNNHVEKTVHPCQFPVELVERLVLSLTRTSDWILDPFLGTGSTIIAAIKNGRRGAGADIDKEYIKVATRRIHKAFSGELLTRPMNKPIYDPKLAGTISRQPSRTDENGKQYKLLEDKGTYAATSN